MNSFIAHLCLPLLLLSPATLLSAEQKPNIIVIIADDLGWNDLNCYGNEHVDTPHLDKLASKGLRFLKAYAAAPVCSPSRAAAMTGQSPARIQLTNHISRQDFAPENAALKDAFTRTELPPEAFTYAELLKEAGYATGFFGKWHLSIKGRKGQEVENPAALPDNQGFDVNVGGGGFGGPPSWWSPYKNPYLEDGPDGEYLPDRLAREAISFMKAHKEEPFHITLWQYLVHSPIKANEELIQKYRQRKRAGKNIRNPTFAAMVEAMDTAVGHLLIAVEELGLEDNTLVIFASDNGGVESLSNNGPLRRGKSWLYEGGLRIPFIATWPGKISPGVNKNTPIILTDLLPTLADVSGSKLDPSIPLDGVNLLPLMTEKEPLKRDRLYFHYPNYAWHGKNRLGGVIISGKDKLILRYEDDTSELYDLETDLEESRDLSTSNPELVGKLKAELKAWLKKSEAAMPVSSEN